MLEDKYQDNSHKAWTLGRAYGASRSLKTVLSTDAMFQDAIMLGCPHEFLDVFKYGAMSMWRRTGQLINSPQYAGDLCPGDVFSVEPPDPEGPTRVCLTNDPINGIRWDWPHGGSFWSSMGHICVVTIVTLTTTEEEQ